MQRVCAGGGRRRRKRVTSQKRLEIGEKWARGEEYWRGLYPIRKLCVFARSETRGKPLFGVGGGGQCERTENRGRTDHCRKEGFVNLK